MDLAEKVAEALVTVDHEAAAVAGWAIDTDTEAPEDVITLVRDDLAERLRPLLAEALARAKVDAIVMWLELSSGFRQPADEERAVIERLMRDPRAVPPGPPAGYAAGPGPLDLNSLRPPFVQVRELTAEEMTPKPGDGNVVYVDPVVVTESYPPAGEGP
jgi:hypothetical protein